MTHTFTDPLSEKDLTFETAPGFQRRHHKSPSDSHICICLQGFLSFSKQNRKCIFSFCLLPTGKQWNKTSRHKTVLYLSKTINFPKDSLLYFSPLSFLGKGRLFALPVCVCVCVCLSVRPSICLPIRPSVCLFLITYKSFDKFSVNFVGRIFHWKLHTFLFINPHH